MEPRSLLVVAALGIGCLAGRLEAYDPPTPKALPPKVGLPDAFFDRWKGRRDALLADRAKFVAAKERNKVSCGKVRSDDNPTRVRCQGEYQELKAWKGRLETSIATYDREFEAALAAARFEGRLEAETRALTDAKVIAAMLAHARKLGWPPEEVKNLEAALAQFAGFTNGATRQDVQEVWREMNRRAGDPELTRLASAGRGPIMPGAGQQSFGDCAVFAVANAAGVPYSVAAARAAALIREGGWRGPVSASHPQATIEKQGLIGGEVVMLAEAFGQAKIIEPEDFAQTLRDGRPVMINTRVGVPGSAPGNHEVVLTRTFEKDGETWYQLRNSWKGHEKPLYVSQDELDVILAETGVAYAPDPGTRVSPLR